MGLGAPLLTWVCALASVLASTEGAPCSNGCSSHGECQLGATGGSYCACDAQWNTTAGPDCSLRACPSDVAWWDHATSTDIAHADAECSNMGVCDSATGQCMCAAGFEGAACERLACPTASSSVCSGRGRCLSMREAAEEKNDVTLFTATTYDMWDAAKIFGCVCDEGFTGYDCSLRTCPSGLDTVGTSYVAEKQVLECTCPTTCTGSFQLSFRGQTLTVFPTDAAADFEARLEALSTVVAVDVTLYGGTTVCDNDGVSSEITFRSLQGDVPAIVVGPTYATTLTSNGGSVAVSVVEGGGGGAKGGTSRTGTAPVVECSGRGVCNRQFGTCFCQNTGVAGTGGSFHPSDGEGAAGTIADCGHDDTTPTGCAVADGGSGIQTTCASSGSCDGTTFKCACNTGFTGNTCTLRTCPSGLAWFDEASAADSAHATAECSNMGICDVSTGVCACRAGFAGDACERLACPGEADEDTGTCNGHGTCYSMRQLAVLSEDNGELRGVTYGVTPSAALWDHSSVYGCYCDSGYFHGPFAWDFSDFTGSYDCTLLTCPYGDNPQTEVQTNEVQTVVCVATSGYFTMTFRQDTTPDIAFDASVETLKLYLEGLYSVHEVGVAYSGGSTTKACSAGGTNIVLSFFVPGDLPLISVDSSQLGSASVGVEETTPGTTEFAECSGQGVCDRTTGLCKCFAGYVSSDGSGDGTTVGQRGDCGAMYIFPEKEEVIL